MRSSPRSHTRAKRLSGERVAECGWGFPGVRDRDRSNRDARSSWRVRPGPRPPDRQGADIAALVTDRDQRPPGGIHRPVGRRGPAGGPLIDELQGAGFAIDGEGADAAAGRAAGGFRPDFTGRIKAPSAGARVRNVGLGASAASQDFEAVPSAESKRRRKFPGWRNGCRFR